MCEKRNIRQIHTHLSIVRTDIHTYKRKKKKDIFSLCFFSPTLCLAATAVDLQQISFSASCFTRRELGKISKTCLFKVGQNKEQNLRNIVFFFVYVRACACVQKRAVRIDFWVFPFYRFFHHLLWRLFFFLLPSPLQDDQLLYFLVSLSD